MNNEYRKIIEEAGIRDIDEGREELIIKLHRERDEAREALDKTYSFLFDMKMEPTRRLEKAQEVLFDFCIPHRPFKASEPPRTAGEQQKENEL
jgi:hypothetical protein